MSGPVPMALGPFLFESHGFGFTDLTRKTDTTWAELETVGGLNALQWTGPRSEVVTINGVLFPQEFGGQASLKGVQLAAKSGMRLMLVSLGGAVFGNYAVQKVSEDRSFHDRYGTPGRNAFSIELKRVGSGFSLLSILGVL